MLAGPSASAPSLKLRRTAGAFGGGWSALPRRDGVVARRGLVLWVQQLDGFEL
jgi:hypothetical protein